MTDYGAIKRKCEAALENEMSVVLCPKDVLRILSDIYAARVAGRQSAIYDLRSQGFLAFLEKESLYVDVQMVSDWLEGKDEKT